jgi:two-component system, NtrC family, sensor kinase
VGRRRSLRQKLRLGLAAVAVSVGLLAAGTAYGIYAYYTSSKTTHKKLLELTHANTLLAQLGTLDQTDQSGADAYQILIAQCLGHLDNYRTANVAHVADGYDPDGGEAEADLMQRLENELKALAQTVKVQQKPGTTDVSPPPLRHLPAVRESYERVRRTAEALRAATISDIESSGHSASAAVRKTAWSVGFFFVWAVVLLFTMMFYFRTWLFGPIRELQAGVQRVHGGNFAQPIAILSGDELQELGDEFNAMVKRLHEVYADLARQVTERSRQLVRSERMVSVGFLAAGVAHEINNPLASILFCSEALERRLQEVLSAIAANTRGAPVAETEVLARYLKMIQQEALRCKEITTKLLDFSRTGDRRKEAADIGGLIRGVLEVAKHLPASRGKAVTFEPTGYVVAPVNAQDLKSVILNLVVNALDSMDDGGRLAISLSTNGGYAEMVFADSGCGMAPDVLQNIFEPFYTKSRTGKGTGLGLFISHQIVDQHGGTITASSTGPGTGSTFTVRIPLQQAGAPELDADAPNVLPFPGGNRAAA